MFNSFRRTYSLSTYKKLQWIWNFRKTRDDAIGEAFDKVARVIGLGYPGGPKVDKLAKEGVANIELPKPHMEGLDFSFSGIKTAIINLHHKNPDINKANLCASFEKDVTEILLENTIEAAKKLNINKIALAGGVSANSYIRQEFLKLQAKGYEIYYPEWYFAQIMRQWLHQQDIITLWQAKYQICI